MSYPVILYPQAIARFRQQYSPPRVDEPERIEKLQVYLKLLADTLRGKVMQPQGASDAPLGASEAAFGQILKEYFGDRVHSQLKFPIPGRDTAYSADFALTFQEVGVAIDIEVDEPFRLKTKRATHSINHYRDRYRNTFFLKGNWIIARFAEEQVVLHPASCCKELAFVIASLMGLRQYQKALEAVPFLQPVEQWTKRQARTMILANSRSRYLPKGQNSD